MRALLLAMLTLLSGPVAGAPSMPQLFGQHCASCHGVDRLGGSGPALLPQSLARMSKSAALETITHGRVATRMPAFNGLIATEELKALADYLYTPPLQEPHWEDVHIRASRIEYHALGSLPDKPVFSADLLNHR